MQLDVQHGRFYVHSAACIVAVRVCCRRCCLRFGVRGHLLHFWWAICAACMVFVGCRFRVHLARLLLFYLCLPCVILPRVVFLCKRLSFSAARSQILCLYFAAFLICFCACVVFWCDTCFIFGLFLSIVVCRVSFRSAFVTFSCHFC